DVTGHHDRLVILANGALPPAPRLALEGAEDEDAVGLVVDTEHARVARTLRVGGLELLAVDHAKDTGLGRASIRGRRHHRACDRHHQERPTDTVHIRPPGGGHYTN